MSKDNENGRCREESEAIQPGVVVTRLDEPTWEEIEAWLEEDSGSLAKSDSDSDDDSKSPLLSSDGKE